MRRLALIVFAAAALSLRGLAAGPVVSVDANAHGGADRIEAVSAGAVPFLTSASHVTRGVPFVGFASSVLVTWALALCAMVASFGLTRPLARSHARSQPSRAPPQLLV